MTTTYTYSALTADGRTVTGKTKGTSIHSVASTLVDQGLEVQGVRAKRNLAKLEITPYKAERADVMHFSRQLSAFIKAGVPIADAIDILHEEMKDKVLRGVLTDMSESLRRGDSLASAIAPHADVFPPFYVSVLKSVELTGQLDVVLDQLSQYIERDLEARRKFKSALGYPVMVMALSVATVGIMAFFVLPRFKTFFEEFDAKLPLPTRMLLGFTDIFTTWWWLMALVTFVFVITMLTFGRTPRGRRLRHGITLKVPMVGVVVRYAVVERFCRILCSMVKAGVPLPDALRLASDGSNNAVFEDALKIAREQMIEGQGLADPIAQTKLFPGAVNQMLAVGENTGTLDEQLESMAAYYEKELEYKLKALTTMFEPLTILFMAGVVGFVAVALVSAMYGIFGQVNV
jgi:type IV pilus assembly protein PilC